MLTLSFSPERYPHRINQDGTMDSICPRCYATIGTSTWEADLDRLESSHVCEPSRLRHFDEQRIQPGIYRRGRKPRGRVARGGSPARPSS